MSDKSGNVIVVGEVEDFFDSDAVDITVAAYSSAGVPLWTNRFDGPSNYGDTPQAVAVDNAGNVFVTGRTKVRGVDWDYSTLDWDYVTLSYSSSGTPRWANYYNGPNSLIDRARAIAVDGSGNVFVTGFSRPDAASFDIATVAYSNAGAPLWTNRYKGGNGHAQLVCVDDSCKRFAASLTTHAFYQQIFVLSEKDATQRRRTIQKDGILEFRSAVGLRSQHVHPANAKSHRNGTTDVHVRVELKTQGIRPIARSLRRPGESRDSSAILSVRVRLSAMALSKSSLWS